MGVGFDNLSITQAGNDALVSANGRDLAILAGIKADSLNADNFVFV